MNSRHLGCLIFLILTTDSGLSWAAEGSLYQRLGGKRAIASLVSDSVDRLASDPRLMADPRLSKLQSRLDRKQVKSALTEMLCRDSGGPCPSRATVIRNAPRDLKLQPREWMDVMGDVNSVLDQHHIPARERNDLLRLLMSVRGK